MRARLDFPSLKRAVIDQINVFKPEIVLIEDKASGVQLIQELRSMGHSIINEYKPQGDIFMRARAQTAAFEGGFLKLPVRAPWLPEFEHELTTFPRGKFDDQVDTTAQALAWMSINGVKPGTITYYRELVEGRNQLPN
jgi:predicted phage terminase large subunit-like protein